MVIYSKPDEDKENKKDTISPVAELHLEEDWSVNWSYNNYFHSSWLFFVGLGLLKLMLPLCIIVWFQISIP